MAIKSSPILISKTLFRDFLACPKNLWLKLHEPRLAHKFVISASTKHLLDQGNEVESCARGLFPEGVAVVGTGEEACEETVRLMTTKVSALFQATFVVDGFIAKNDVLTYNAGQDTWNLFEIKSSTEIKEDKKEDYISDVAFQASVLRRAHVPIDKFFLVHVNKEYVRSGELDIRALFTTVDVTERVKARLPEIEGQMEVAREYLNKEKEPVGNCECIYEGRSNHCATFEHSNRQVPPYSVHDLARISKKKLNLLVERGIFDLNDIPEDFELTDNQTNQLTVHRRQKPVIDADHIRKELGDLIFPLYFFDYETFSPAIPIFDGYAPYDKIPFQFSLHILKDPSAKLTHVEFLHEQRTDPSHQVASLLEENIGAKGTVVSWFKHFEVGVNKDIAARLPSHAAVFERINKSMYDLMGIFQGQHYLHHGFQGSVSLKAVLPTLVPELSYDDLDIQEGQAASNAWWKMVSPATSPEESVKIASDLKLYCGRDTEAMYRIWEHLIKIAA